MAAPEISQAALYALVGGAVPADVTQSALYALSGGQQPANISQVAIYALTGTAQPGFVTQSVIYALAYLQPCLSTVAQCWKIQRRDGIKHLFTSHDRPITFGGEVYDPCGSIEASAYQNSGAMGDVGNANLSGLLALVPDDAGIPARDIAAGLLDGAAIYIWEVPWEEDSSELPLPLMRGILGKISLKNATYEGEVVSLSSLLNDRGLLENYTATCRYMLGDARCTVDLYDYTESGQVTGQVAGNARTLAWRRQFFDTARVEAENYWQNGTLTWLSGDNAGYSSEVAASAVGAISLWEAMPNHIAVSDQYEIVAGCDKTPGTCFGKFNNILNYGGFPDVPGNDVVMQTPDAKQ